MSSADTPATAASHIFVFPYPAQGHMLPLLDLTHQLALHGLKITILVTPKNLPILDTLLATHPNSIHTLVLPFPTHPELPLGVENVKDIGGAGNAPVTAALTKLEGEVIKWFRSHPSPPQAIVSDFFLGFTNHWAQQLDLPRFVFYSSGAFALSIMHHLLQNIDALWNSEIIDFPNLPRSPSFLYEHLPQLFKSYKKGGSDWKISKEARLENWNSWGLIFNSFYALEAEYMDHIKKEVGHSRIYSVGPLNSIGLSQKSGTGSDELDWLDTCPAESVVYVCFGSQKVLTKPQMEALALSLEQCKTRFLWVVKSEASHTIPDGFEERVTDRGLVVHGWAPQTEILNHKAVGGFVSHCGWNSLLESIMAGVMILAWPMEADQFINARLLVDYMGSAVGLCEGGDMVPDPNVFSQVIRESLGGNIAQAVRVKMIRDKAIEAVNGGSSVKNLNALLKEFKHI